MVSQTAFWKAFVDRITKHRAVISRMCETEEDVKALQGKLKGLDFVLGKNERDSLPEIIIRDLKNKE